MDLIHDEEFLGQTDYLKGETNKLLKRVEEKNSEVLPISSYNGGGDMSDVGDGQSNSSSDDFEEANATLVKATYISSDEYMSNMSEDECATFFCTECGKKFNNNVSLKAHLAKKHNPRALANCELCYSKYRGDFHEHLKSEHSLSDGSFFCKKCEFICADFKVVADHQHFKDVFHTCKYCGKIYKSKENYTMHLLKHNNGSNFDKKGRIYNCETCGKKIVVSEVPNDLKTQMDIKSYLVLKCQMCRSLHSQKSPLNQHTTKVDIGRSHKCSKCNRVFFRGGDLKKHMRSHSGKQRLNTKCKEICIK